MTKLHQLLYNVGMKEQEENKITSSLSDELTDTWDEAKEITDTSFNIPEELKKLPKKPGVYLMHGPRDEVIYVGKAVNLRNRVRQYFQSSRGKSA